MASRKVELVVNGIKNLSQDEKKELAKVLSGASPGFPNTAMERLEESFKGVNAVHTAPIGSGTCNCCGK